MTRLTPFTTPLTPDQTALVNAHVKMVQIIVARYVRQFPSIEHLREDLLQEGMLAICHASQKYDPALLYTFGTYATYWVNAWIKELGRNTQNPVRAPGQKSRTTQRAPPRYIERAEMPHVDPSETPDHDRRLDAEKLAVAAREALEERVGKKKADIFFRTAMPDGARCEDMAQIARQYRMSQQRIRFLREHIRHTYFAPWAASVRNEAA